MIWQKKVATVIFFLLMTLVLVNYFSNVWTYQGTDVVDMYHPMKLLTLSNWSKYSFYLMQYFPLLVVVPAGFALFTDKQLNQYIFIQSRLGARYYLLGKMIVVFSVTFFVFSVPFLIEILLNLIAFPVSAVGDPSNIGIYDVSYISGVHMQLFSGLYIQSPYLYAVVFTLFFGVFSGVLALFTVAVSTFPIKFKVLLFLPVYLLLYLVSLSKQLIPTIPVDTNYFLYLPLFNLFYNPTGSLMAWVTFTVSLCLLSILIIVVKMRRDAM
ncbi:hypothetical protein [Amphibacillus sediminis]|uniref:hypothetical protein n=1 Tax=Amphibacillus sediminis TaxID=360185 RepID=UPI0012EE66D8|nr:hypothetical protein [Amphibacillus sediminis]